MAAPKKPRTVQTTGQRAGKTTARARAIQEAAEAGATGAELAPAGITDHPAKKTRSRAAKPASTPAPKSQAKKPAGKGARVPGKKASPAKGKKTPVKPPEADTPAQEEAQSVMGRPTLYKDEYRQQLIDYFNIAVERIEVIEVPTGKEDKDGRPIMTTEHKTVLNTFPTLTRFAASIGVTRETLHDWATAKNPDGTLRRPDFSYAYARAKDLQESLIIEGGMAGRYEARFASLAAKNLIGWRDQVDTKVEATVTNASKEDLEAIYQKRMAAMEANKAAAIARQAAAGQGGGE
ncbi:terminase small subunit [Cupriavidus pauculus]|uniref:terminase small subunit n=1 Tax=Cupriavidus pauculus TaxID=82633 RepID=UPI001D0C335F|nr:terminase small subunit [Cupriavidus pauculus]